MSAASAARRSRPQLRGRFSLFAVVPLVVIAAIAGLVLGGVFRGGSAPSEKPRATTIAEAGIRLQLPSGWVRGGATTLSGFDQPLSVSNPEAHVRAAVELLPAASPTLLPVGLHVSGAPTIVQLGQGTQAWRYRSIGSDGAPLVLYAAPTTKGIATVGCLDVSGGAAERACRAVVSALTVPGSRRIEPGQRAAFLSRLPTTVAGLDAARGKGVRALHAATRATGQALAADGLARAHRAAAADLAPVSSAGDSLASETVGALGATASAYTALANAARARTPQPYAAAGSAVTGADGQLRRTMAKVAAAVDASTTRAAALVTPAAKPATTPASTPAATPASTPAAQPTTTPAAKPAHTPASKRAKEPVTKSAGQAVIDAETKPIAVATQKKGGSHTTLLLLLLIGGVGGYGLALLAKRMEQGRAVRRP